MKQQFEEAVASVKDDPAGEALLRSQYGFWLGKQGSWREAAAQFGDAAELAVTAGEHELEAQYRYAAALALQKAPRSKGKAKRAMRIAAKGLQATGDTGRYAQSQRHQAATEAQAGRLQQALKIIRRAQDNCPDDNASRARLALDEGVYSHLLGQRSQAAHALRHCQELAATANLPGLQRQAEAMFDLLIAAPKEGNPLAEQLALSIRQQDGVSQPLGRALTALKENQLDRALTQAHKCQKEALEGRDMDRYINYSTSSLLIAIIQERQGRDSHALGTLLSTKRTLEHYLGPEVGQSINRTLDALCRRWGPERTDNALRRYRKAMQKQV